MDDNNDLYPDRLGWLYNPLGWLLALLLLVGLWVYVAGWVESLKFDVF